MTPTIQILQVSFFCISILALLTIGILILSRTVSIIDRRFYLVVFIPLLLANTLVILEGESLRFDWRTWLILGTDLVLILAVIWFSRGWQVYGLNVEAVENALTEALTNQGLTVETRTAEKRDLWGKTREDRLLAVEGPVKTQQFWITARFNEVLIQPEQRADTRFLRQALPALKKIMIPYDLKTHTVGILYVVLALVFSVLAWIFFFEPRFILID